MRFKLLQAVRLPPGPKGKDYPRGNHELPEDVVGHPFFRKLIDAGLVLEGEAVHTDKPVTNDERKTALLDKVARHAKQKLAGAKASEANAEKSAQLPSEKVSKPGSAGGDETPAAPAESSAPKSDEELLAEMEAEEKKADSKKNKNKK